MASFGDKKEYLFQVLLYLEFGTDKMGDQSGGDGVAINDLELAEVSQGSWW